MGYLFLKGDEEARLVALRAHRLVSVLEVDDQKALARPQADSHHAELGSGRYPGRDGARWSDLSASRRARWPAWSAP